MPTNIDTPITYNYLTVGQAAKLLQISIKTVRRWNQDGSLHAVRNKLNQRLFDPKELVKLKQSRLRPATTTPLPKYLSISAAAQHLGLSIKTIRRWDKTGRIQSIRNQHNHRLFSLESVEKAKQLADAQHQLPALYKPTNRFRFPALFRFPPVYAYPSAVILIIFTTLLVGSFNSNQPLLYPDSVTPSSAASPNPTTDVELPPFSTTFGELNKLKNSSITIEPPPNNTVTDIKQNNKQINTTLSNKVPINSDQWISTNSLPNQSTIVYALILSSQTLTQYNHDISVPATNQPIVIECLNQECLTNSQLKLSAQLTGDSLTQTGIRSLLDKSGNLLSPKSTNPAPIPPSPTLTPTGNAENNGLQSLPQTKLNPPVTGQAIFPSLSTTISVPEASVTPDSQIFITFNDDFSPAQSFWVTKTTGQFTLHLDQPPSHSIPFSWMIY